MRKTMRILLALALCLSLAAPGLTVFAQSNGDFVVENGVVTGYRGCGGDAVIPDGVTAIEMTSYSTGYRAVTSVTIPASVTNINAGTFHTCEKLTAIHVDAENPSYTDVDGVLYNKDMAVLHTYPQSRPDTTYTIPDGVTRIEEEAFYDCKNLTDMTVPTGVLSIGEDAFYGCENLTDVTIPESVTEIGGLAFWRTPWLNSQGEFPIVNGILLDYQGDGGDVTVPDGVTVIADYAFYSYDEVTGVTLPESVTYIGECAFERCERMANINIPAGVTSIGWQAFYECNSLTDITVPAGVTFIDEGTFSGCDSLTVIHVAPGNPNYRDVDGVLYSRDRTVLYTYPAGKQAGPYRIPQGVIRIADTAFDDCRNLTGVTIPASVTSIGLWAFIACTGLTEVTIPGSVAVVGDAFMYCENLNSVTLLPGVTNIEEWAFALCYGLTSVTIPASVTVIGDFAFNDCKNLTDIYYGGSEEQWKSIDISRYDDELRAAVIHYNSVIPDPTPVDPAPTDPGTGGSSGGGSVSRPSVKEEEPASAVTYSDVPANAWYADAVSFVTEKGLMSGTGTDTFAPAEPLTRAMLVQLLYNNEGKPTVSGNAFTDVQDGAWYMNAVIWAAEKGIVSGYGDGRFGPNDNITREQFVAMLWRYAGQPESTVGLNGFTDINKAGDYARTALQWAVEKGILGGKGNGMLDPTGNATRREAAQMLMNYFQ